MTDTAITNDDRIIGAAAQSPRGVADRPAGAALGAGFHHLAELCNSCAGRLQALDCRLQIARTERSDHIFGFLRVEAVRKLAVMHADIR